MLLQPLHAAVGGAVVHHQQFKVPADLPIQRRHTGFHEFQAIIIWNDDRYFLHTHASTYCSFRSGSL